MRFLEPPQGFGRHGASGFAFVAKDSVRDRDEEILMKSVFVPRPGVIAGPKTSSVDANRLSVPGPTRGLR